MKRGLFLFYLTAIISVSLCYGGDFRVPLDNDGVKARNMDESFVRIISTGYTTVASMLLRGAAIQIYGVLTSTRPAGSEEAHVFLRSTDTANTSSELLVPPLNISSETRNSFYVFDPPILCPTGLSVNLSSAGTFVSIFYNYAATSTASNYLIPRDMDGIKASPDMYGVQVASRVSAGDSADDNLGADAFDNSTTERLVIGERAFFYGVMGTSSSGNNFLIVEDTGSTLGDPQNIFPHLFYGTFNYENTVTPSLTPIVTFPWAILMQNGISVTPSESERLRIFARPARRLRY